tara:strand:+ start:89 stop:673 length:585 start_codon:yes stop_codon:yes gene_type:complete
MFIASVRTVAPSEAAVSLADMKEFLYIADTDSDALITAHIATAEKWLEDVAGLALLTQTRRASYECLGDDRILILPRPPLQSVTSLEYLDINATWQTISSALYDDQLDRKPARLQIRSGSVPSVHSTIDLKWRVTYVAGFADTAAELKTAEPTLVHLVQCMVKDIDDGCGFDNSRSAKAILKLYRIQPISLDAA